MKSFLLSSILLLLSLAFAHGQISAEPKLYKVILSGENSTIPLTATKMSSGYAYCTSADGAPQGVDYRIDINCGIDKGVRYNKGSVMVVVFRDSKIIGNVQYHVTNTEGISHKIQKSIKETMTKKDASKEDWEQLKKFVSFSELILVPPISVPK